MCVAVCMDVCDYKRAALCVPVCVVVSVAMCTQFYVWLCAVAMCVWLCVPMYLCVAVCAGICVPVYGFVRLWLCVSNSECNLL